MKSIAKEEISLGAFMEYIKERNPNQPEFHQAVEEVAESILPFLAERPEYRGYNLMKRLTEPDRVFSFRVTWVDDDNNIRVNRGYRVQFNNAIGPYKGGLRFHPNVNLSVLKFLGFEQIFKNSLTTLPLGGGKGGADFEPKGKSDREVMRFCQAFMNELQRHIGPDSDVPAGDIGVGAREIGYLYGQYKKIRQEHTGVLTGKGEAYGGSLIRPEATGYGCIYFLQEMIDRQNDSLEEKRCNISGAGNVAQYALEKALQLKAVVQTVSDTGGFLYCKDGLNEEMVEYLKELKNERRGRLREMADHFDLPFYENKKPWSVPCDVAIPCATQNEILKEDAVTLVDNGCQAVSEGANMPTHSEAIEVFKDAGVLYAPGKASNAGGVATSGLEMTQNSLRLKWDREEVDQRLRIIMKDIHDKCVKYGRNDDGSIDYTKGANISGFVKVADAMIAQGVV